MMKKGIAFMVCSVLFVCGCMSIAFATGEAMQISDSSTGNVATTTEISVMGENITTSDSLGLSDVVSRFLEFDLQTILIVIILLIAIVVVIITLALPKIKRDNGDEFSEDVQKTENIITNNSLKPVVTVANGQNINKSPKSSKGSGKTETILHEIEKIPEGINKPISIVYRGCVVWGEKEEITYVDNADNRSIDYDGMHKKIKAIYSGEATPESLTESVKALNIENVYNLKIMDSAKPEFTVSYDKYDAKYVLVAERYLYINYNIYSGDDFKLYSDIDVVDKCFNITNSKRTNSFNYGANIRELKPALLVPKHGGYELLEKGIIVVD